MVRLTLSGSGNNRVLLVNPDNIIYVKENQDRTCDITLVEGKLFTVNESVTTINRLIKESYEERF